MNAWHAGAVPVPFGTIIGSIKDTRDDNRHRPEDRWARWAAIVVALFGLVIVVLPAMLHIGDVFADPFVNQTKSQVSTPSGHPPVPAAATESHDQPLIDGTLGDGGLLLLRVAVVALAAFLAGATMQRIGAADFAGKFGPFELRKLSTKAAAASSTSIERLARRLDSQMAVTRKAVKVASDVARRVDALERHQPN